MKIRHVGSMMKVSFLTIAVIGAISIPMLGQAPAETKPSFEVASVKPSVSRDAYLDGTPGGRFIATAVPLRLLITQAYRVRDAQIIGGPSWMNTDPWDVEGKPKAEEVAAPPPTGVRDPMQPSHGSLMLQSLLEDRFQFKFHWETRELPVYELTVAKGGPKIKASAGVPSGRPRLRTGRGSFEAYEILMAHFIYSLATQLDRIVVDKTNLNGLYDINLKWTDARLRAGNPPTGAEPAPPQDQPSIFTAIQEQLGLKLESARAPIEVLVVDSVHKPTEN